MKSRFRSLLLKVSTGPFLLFCMWTGCQKPHLLKILKLLISFLNFIVLQLEELQGFCDPNPIEFVEHDVAEPNTVFYWGLSSNGRSSIDVDSLKEEFMKSVDNGDQGSGCRLELTIVNSQQLPKNAQFDCVSERDSKAYWRIPDYRRPRQPVYSQHLPHYCVGYVSNNRVEHPNDGG